MSRRETYKCQGYIVEKGIFDPAEIEKIRAEAKAIFISQMERLGIIEHAEISEGQFERGMFKFFEVDTNSFVNCGKQAQHLISLHRLSLDRRIVLLLEELGLEAPIISTRPLLYFNSSRLAKKEVYWRLSMHQDWRSMQGSLDAMVVWIPLVSVNDDLGALQVFPGTHRGGLLASKMEDGYGHIDANVDPSAAVSVELEAGDALFFSALLVHQSGTNVTDSIRWSCHFRYNNLRESSFVARGFPHPYVYRPQVELITPDFPATRDIDAIFGP